MNVRAPAQTSGGLLRREVPLRFRHQLESDRATGVSDEKEKACSTVRTRLRIFARSRSVAAEEQSADVGEPRCPHRQAPCSEKTRAQSARQMRDTTKAIQKSHDVLQLLPVQRVHTDDPA